MKLSNKILIGLLTVVIIFQLFSMFYVRSFIKKAMVDSNDINLTIWNDLMDSETTEKEFDFDDFDELTLQMRGNVIINQSTDYKVTVKGPIDFLNSEYFDISTKGSTLEIDCPAYRNSHYELYTIIEMPTLKKIKASERVDIILEGFEEKHLKVQLTGDCALQGNNNRIDDLEIDLFGETDFDFENSIVKKADIRSMGETEVSLEVAEVEIHAFGESDFQLHMNGGDIKGSIIGDGNIEYTGEIDDNKLNFLGPGKVHKR